MLNLEEEVVDDAFGQLFAMFGFQAEEDEIGVPSVHLVEAAAGNDVRVGQVEQALRGRSSG